jgi:hypothetical protein
MEEYIDKSKHATAKARSVRKKILQHKRRFRLLKQNPKSAYGPALCTTNPISPLVETTPTFRVNGISGLPTNDNIGSSSIGSSQFSRISDFGQRHLVESLTKIRHTSHGNKENSFPTPHSLFAARTNKTPLADISTAVANQRSTTHQSSTHKSSSSQTLLNPKKCKPRAQFKHLQVNLANKFSSATTNPVDITHPVESQLDPQNSADPITTTKRKQTLLLPTEVPLTQHESSDTSDHESFNEESEEYSSDEDGPEEHIGVNCNTPQGLYLNILISNI